MGQGAILESISNGNWTIENPLTGVFQNNNKFEIFNNVIEKYASDLEKFDKITQNRNYSDAWEKQPVLDIPLIHNKYDILNEKKFSKKVQRWKGIVLEVFENYFEVKLYDLTNPSSIYEIGELDIDDISPEDKILLKPGSIFYWTVGHFMENGQIVKKSELRFQRLITLDDEDMEEIFTSVDLKFNSLKERKIEF